MWFFSQNIQRLEKQYGPWNPKWTGLPEIIPYEGDYFNFTMSFSRTWSYNGQTGTETVYPTNIIVKSDPDSMILQIDYDPSRGAGILTVHEHKETGVKNATIEAVYDSGDIHLSNMFSITQEPEPWNVHVIMINNTGKTYNIEFTGTASFLTNNEENDAKGSWDVNHKTMTSYSQVTWMDVGYFNTRNGTDTITATKTFTFRLNTYNEGGSAISANYKMYMTLNEEAPGTSGPGPSITQSQTLENLQSNHSYDNTYTLTFQKPTTIFSEMEFVLYVTIE